MHAHDTVDTENPARSRIPEYHDSQNARHLGSQYPLQGLASGT